MSSPPFKPTSYHQPAHPFLMPPPRLPVMEFVPALSPSTFSDDTLPGSPDMSKTRIDGTKDDQLTFDMPFGEVVTEIQPGNAVPYDRTPIHHRDRRNAVSAQPSNDDSIVCQGPTFGAVFGNLSGGSGNLSYHRSSYFSKEANRLRPTHGRPAHHQLHTTYPPHMVYRKAKWHRTMSRPQAWTTTTATATITMAMSAAFAARPDPVPWPPFSTWLPCRPHALFHTASTWHMPTIDSTRH